MATDHHRLLPPLLALLAAGSARAQDLRLAVADADVVAVGRQVGKTPFSPDVDLHRVQLLLTVRGPTSPLAAVTVIDWPNLSLHNRPQPRQQRLYCLLDAAREAQRLGLPADQGPYFRLSGRAGSNPLVGADLDADPSVRLCRVLTATERGVAPAAATAALFDLALGPDATARLEATRHLAEQPLLRTHLQATQWSALLSRTSGETADLDYKIALAELCAEQRLPGLVDAMLVGLDSTHDERYARAVGRILASQRGDDAAAALLQRLRQSRDADDRRALLLALGATRTGPALDALLQLKQAGADDAVEAALREHGSRTAIEATAPRPAGRDSGR